MKKLIGLLLAFAMLLSLGTCAFAEAAPEVVERPYSGYHFVVPESYQKLRGTLEWYDESMDDIDPGVCYVELMYYAMNAEQMSAYGAYCDAYGEAVLTDAELPEPSDPRWASGALFGNVFTVFGIGGGRGQAELEAAVKAYFNPDRNSYTFLEDLGPRGDTHFYLAQRNYTAQEEADQRENMGEFYAEYAALRTDRESFLNSMSLSEPLKPKTISVGDLVSFETVRLDGTPVTSAELFKDHDVTMLNLWATWCLPCRVELPELQKLSEQFKDKSFQIIGICYDADEEGKTAEAQAMLDKAGVRYLNLIAPENIGDVLPALAIPSSFFVDSEGRILVEPVVGAYWELYAGVVEQALSLTAASQPAAASAPTRVAAERAPTAGLPVEEFPPAPEESAPAAVIVEEAVPAPEAPATETGLRIDCPNLGIFVYLPQTLAQLQGTLSANEVLLSEDSAIREAEFDYTALPPERYEALYNAVFVLRNAQSEELREFIADNVRLFSVFSVGRDESPDALREAYEKYYGMPLQEAWLEKIAMDGEHSFYYYPHYILNGATLPEGAYAEELRQVVSSVDDIVSSLTIAKPAA